MTDGFGSITWWGFSPALDLQDPDTCPSLKDKDEKLEDDPLNILIVGCGDCRHILQTMARKYRWQKRKLHFYVLESSLEIYAKDLLLLTLALEPPERMGLQEKTEFFLEIYGNTLVRKQTSDYIERLSNEFIKMVTDFEYLEQKMPIIDMSLLKFKERDFLESIFKFWRNPDERLFDAKKCWELRLRQNLGVRYDSMSGVFDWDYSMKLCELGADIIHKAEYNKWRSTGIAFEIREGNYDTPNKTMASGRVLRDQEGDRVARRGYWGDIIVSPYICFGTESENENLFKVQNRCHTKASTDVSEYNVLSLLHELSQQTHYVPPADEEDPNTTEPGPALTEIKEEPENDTVVEPGMEENDVEDRHTVPIPVDDVKVYFLPPGSIADMCKKNKFQKLFEIIYFSNSMVHHLQPGLNAIFSDRATVLVETTKYMIELTKEQSSEFALKIGDIAIGVGCQAERSGDSIKDAMVGFAFQR